MSLSPSPNRVRRRIHPRSLLTAGGCVLAGMAAAALFSTAPVAGSRPAAAVLALPAKPPGGAVGVKLEAELQQFLHAGTPFQQLTAALHLGENATSAELRGLLENAHRFPANAARVTAVAALLKRWLTLEPEAAMEFARLRQEEMLPELIGTWAETEPEAAEAFLRRLPRGDERFFAWRELAGSVLAHHPESIWALLNRATAPESGGADGFENLDSDFLARLVAADPGAASARLDSLSAVLRAQVRHALCLELAKTDPGRAWSLSASLPDSAGLRRQLLQGVFPRDPVTALQLLGSLPPELQERIAYGKQDASSSTAGRELGRPMYFPRIKGILDERTDKDDLWRTGKISTLITALDTTPGLTADTREALATEAFLGAVAGDPRQAALLIPLLPDSAREGALALFVKSMRSRDLSNDPAWLAELPDPLRSSALEIQEKQEAEAARQEEYENAQRAAEKAHVASLSSTEVPKPEGLMAVWLTGEPTLTPARRLAAMTPAQLNNAWPADPPDGTSPKTPENQPPSEEAPLLPEPGAPRSRDEAFEKLAAENPAAAAAWLTTWPPFAKAPAPAGDETSDPEAAEASQASAEPFATGPPAPAAPGIPVEFITTWAASDPTAAAAWVKTLPPGELATTAAAKIADQYHRYAPAEAAAWLNTLPAGPVQEAALKAMAPP